MHRTFCFAWIDELKNINECLENIKVDRPIYMMHGLFFQGFIVWNMTFWLWNKVHYDSIIPNYPCLGVVKGPPI
jgi:hypothetical protein